MTRLRLSKRWLSFMRAAGRSMTRRAPGALEVQSRRGRCLLPAPRARSRACRTLCGEDVSHGLSSPAAGEAYRHCRAAHASSPQLTRIAPGAAARSERAASARPRARARLRALSCAHPRARCERASCAQQSDDDHSAHKSEESKSESLRRQPGRGSGRGGARSHQYLDRHSRTSGAHHIRASASASSQHEALD
eukprot:6183653-Pleurochrysis_carterae.AAC.3